jgi:7-keto-8-aminopelargonate synthetase-like enzyme
VAALCGKGDVVVLDKLSHACLVDGARLSGAAMRIFPHNDLSKLESHLRWARRERSSGRVLVVAESVYSMDGDTAPLREMVELKERHGAWMLLDEAHAVGIIGKQGRGLADAAGVADRIEIQMGTLGKALGAHGAYIAGCSELREFLANRARSFVFSTAPPAPVAAAARRAIEIVRSGEGDALRAALRLNTELFAELAGVPKPEAAIVPFVIGGEAQAMDAAARLLDGGFLVPAIRYPTVARGSARLRVTLTASHREGDIRALADLLPAVRGAGFGA